MAIMSGVILALVAMIHPLLSYVATVGFSPGESSINGQRRQDQMKPICGYSQCVNFHWRMYSDLDNPEIDMVDFIEERIKECLTCYHRAGLEFKDNFKEVK